MRQKAQFDAFAPLHELVCVLKQFCGIKIAAKPNTMFTEFDMGNLIAGIIWGNVGLAMLIYGKKHDNWKTGGIGAAILMLSCLTSWPWLTLASVILCVIAFKG